jgi:predicted Zn-dependent peptidase
VPSSHSPDWPAITLLSGILGSGRSSRLYERLVKDERSAVRVSAGAGFPGDKYANLLLVQATVARGASPDSVESVILEELERMVRDGPTPAELAKVKRRERASFIRGLRSNGGLAGMLAQTQGMYGDWRRVLTYLQEIDAVTAADVQRVASEAFRPGNRCVGVLRKPA